MMKYWCDRCGHTVDVGDLLTIADWSKGKSLHLCPACVRELWKWVEED